MPSYVGGERLFFVCKLLTRRGERALAEFGTSGTQPLSRCFFLFRCEGRGDAPVDLVAGS